MEFIKDADDKKNKEYILQDNKPTKRTIKFLVVGLIILLIAVLISGYFMGYFGEEVIVE